MFLYLLVNARWLSVTVFFDPFSPFSRVQISEFPDFVVAKAFRFKLFYFGGPSLCVAPGAFAKSIIGE